MGSSDPFNDGLYGPYRLISYIALFHLSSENRTETKASVCHRRPELVLYFNISEV